MDLRLLIPAAGASSRFGAEDKLLAPLGGKPLIRHLLDRLPELALRQAVLVTGADSPLVALAGELGLRCVVAPHPEHGMGSSIAAGVAALEPGWDGLFVAPGDMPFLAPALFAAMLARLARAPAPDIVAPVHAGQRGHPVLFGPRCREELSALSGDRGAARLLASGRYDVDLCPVETADILLDIDTPDALRDAEIRLAHQRR